MPKRTGRKLVGGVVVMCGIGCGAVAMAAPASAPEVGTVRAESVSEPVVVDLDGLDAAVDAARLAEAATTTSTVAEPPATEASTTTSTVASRATAAAVRAPAAPAASTTTTTAPAPAPAPSSSAEAAIAHWFPDVYDEAVSVARCESSMNPGAVSSGGGNHGLFQINSVHESDFVAVTGRPWSDVYDADVNAQFARHLYDESGWSPWACSP